VLPGAAVAQKPRLFPVSDTDPPRNAMWRIVAENSMQTGRSCRLRDRRIFLHIEFHSAITILQPYDFMGLPVSWPGVC
jgi:hypothetical protein